MLRSCKVYIFSLTLLIHLFYLQYGFYRFWVFHDQNQFIVSLYLHIILINSCKGNAMERFFFLKKVFPAKVQHYVLSNVKRGDREDQVFRKNICLH